MACLQDFQSTLSSSSPLDCQPLGRYPTVSQPFKKPIDVAISGRALSDLVLCLPAVEAALSARSSASPYAAAIQTTFALLLYDALSTAIQGVSLFSSTITHEFDH